MTKEWEETFVRWSKPPSESEEERISNTKRMIVEALNSHPALKTKRTTTIIQGSFRNNTNIKRDSDIDICLQLHDSFFSRIPDGYKKSEYSISDADYSYAHYKNDVGEALRNKFGPENVTRGNKAYAVNSNSYRVKGDVLPGLEYRYYTKAPHDAAPLYYSGVRFITDDDKVITNWPEQHYQNGVEKNTATGRSYKRTVRILKNLRNKMQDEGMAGANNFPSFLIECLCWNVPNSSYSKQTYTEIISTTLLHIFEGTKNSENCRDWKEVNGIKDLFGNEQPWNHQQVTQFIAEVWNYLGF